MEFNQGQECITDEPIDRILAMVDPLEQEQEPSLARNLQDLWLINRYLSEQVNSEPISSNDEPSKNLLNSQAKNIKIALHKGEQLYAYLMQHNIPQNIVNNEDEYKDKATKERLLNYCKEAIVMFLSVKLSVLDSSLYKFDFRDISTKDVSGVEEQVLEIAKIKSEVRTEIDRISGLSIS